MRRSPHILSSKLATKPRTLEWEQLDASRPTRRSFHFPGLPILKMSTRAAFHILSALWIFSFYLRQSPLFQNIDDTTRKKRAVYCVRGVLRVQKQRRGNIEIHAEAPQEPQSFVFPHFPFRRTPLSRQMASVPMAVPQQVLRSRIYMARFHSPRGEVILGIRCFPTPDLV